MSARGQWNQEVRVAPSEQEALLEQRLSKVMNMIAHLQHVNEKEERQTDEVRAFVKDMLRVFAHEVRCVEQQTICCSVGCPIKGHY